MGAFDAARDREFELAQMRARASRRHRWVRRGLLAFVALMVIGVPLELMAYHHAEALAAREALLPFPGIHLGTAPVVVFGPDGRRAAQRFGNGSWLAPASSRLCDSLAASTGAIGLVEVGFLRTTVGDRGVLAVYCPLTTGQDRLLVAEFAPPHKELGLLIDASDRLDGARIVATPSGVTISDARRGVTMVSGTRTLPNLQ
jgi:hypothetical protein